MQTQKKEGNNERTVSEKRNTATQMNERDIFEGEKPKQERKQSKT